jgi:hypothetical protein
LWALLWIFYLVWGFVLWQVPDLRPGLWPLVGSLIWVIIAQWQRWRSKHRKRAGTANRDATTSDDEHTRR